MSASSSRYASSLGFLEVLSAKFGPQQFRPGVPPSLRVVGLCGYPPGEAFSTIVELGFPTVDLLWMNSNYHTVVRRPGGSGPVEVEEWSSKNTRYNRTDMLTSRGITDSVWKDPFIGDFW